MKHAASYTLFEILVALSIITILSVCSIPLVYKTNYDDVLHEVHHFFSLFSYLQQQAIATNQTLVLTFDQENRSIQYPGYHKKLITYQLPAKLIFGGSTTVLGPPANPSKPITRPLSFALSQQTQKPHVQFHPNGTISAGSLYLTNVTKSCLGALTCGVGHVSYIRTYYYKHGAWTMLHE